MTATTEYKTAERGIERYKTGKGEPRYRVRYLDAGKNRSRSFKTLKDARKYHAKISRARDLGERIERAEENLTLAEVAREIWGPQAKAKLQDVTWERDIIVYNKHILPHLGAMPIAHIDAYDVTQWMHERSEKGVGDPTLIKALAILSSIFKASLIAQRITGVQANPIELVDKPRAKRSRAVNVWHPVVIERVKWLLENDSSRMTEDEAKMDALYLSILMQTGCRPSEALAIEWGDLREGSIAITKAVKSNGVGFTKTQKDRSVQLLDPLKKELQAAKPRRVFGSRYVITDQAGNHWNQWSRRNFTRRHLKPALEKTVKTWAKFHSTLNHPGAPEFVDDLLTSRLYDLGRHTHSAIMLSANTSLIELSRMQGHSVRTLSEHYAQGIPGIKAGSDPRDLILSSREAVHKASKKMEEK